MFPGHLIELCLAALLLVSSNTNSATIQDDPMTAIEPAHENYFFINHGHWLDRYTLAVNVAHDITKLEDYRILLIDIRKKTTKEFMRGAAIACTKPQEGIVGIRLSGTENKNEFAPKLFQWDARSMRLSPKAVNPEDYWNAWVCKKTDKFVVNSETLAQYSIGFLEDNHGQVHVTGDRANLIKKDKQIIPLDSGSKKLAMQGTPWFLPVRNVYFWSTGLFILDDSLWLDSDGTRVQEYPLLTMTPEGLLKQEFFRERLKNAGLNQGSGQSMPYGRGTLLNLPGRPHEGGGIYLVDEKSIKRIWCTNKGNQFDRRCLAIFTPEGLSPDGCHLAFKADSSDDLVRPFELRSGIKILPLCK